MDIKGYKYIAHKLIPRPWGPECRFTVARLTDGSHINEVIPVPEIKIEEKELAILIEKILVRIDVPPEPFIDPVQKQIDEAVLAKEAEIKAILIEKKIMTSDQKIEDIPAKEITAEEVKP